MNLYTSPLNLLEKKEEKKPGHFNLKNVLIHETETNNKGVFGLLPGATRNLSPL